MPAPVDSDDVIAWRFDESSAAWLNTGTAGTLTLVPRTGASTAPTADAVTSDPLGTGRALRVHGDRIHDNAAFSAAAGTGTSLGEIGGNITISLWVYLLDYQSSNYGGLVQKLKAAGGGDTAIQLNYDNGGSGSWYVGLNAGGTNQYPGSGTTIPLNAWTHLGVTYNSTTGALKHYQNGAQVASTTLSTTGAIDYDAHGPWIVGGSYSGYDNVNGYIQDVRVADIVRDAAWFAEAQGHVHGTSTAAAVSASSRLATGHASGSSSASASPSNIGGDALGSSTALAVGAYTSLGTPGVATFGLAIEAGAELTLSWQTDVTKMYDGAEKRTSRRQDPQQSLKGDVFLVGAQVRRLRSQLARLAAMGSTFLLGLPYDGALLRADASGATVYVYDTAKLDWATAGRRVLVVAIDGVTTREGVIQSLTTDSITLEIAPGDVGREGGYIVPAQAIFLEPQQPFSRYRPADPIERWAVAAKFTGAPYDMGAGATLTTFGGKPVYDRRLSVGDAAGDSLQAMNEIVELGGSIFNVGEANQADWGRQISFEDSSLVEFQWLKLFLFTVRGKWKSFWLPTWRNDLVYLSRGTTGGFTTITIDDPDGDFSTWFPSLRQSLMIYQSDHTVTYVTVADDAATDNLDGTWTLNLGDTISGSAIALLSWLDLCRLESDDVTIKLDGMTAQTTVTARAVVNAVDYVQPAEEMCGTEADGALVFDGSTDVMGVTPVGGLYVMTSEINATTITFSSGARVDPNGHAVFSSGATTGTGKFDLNGGDGADGGAGGAGGAGGRAGDTSVASGARTDHDLSGGNLGQEGGGGFGSGSPALDNNPAIDAFDAGFAAGGSHFGGNGADGGIGQGGGGGGTGSSDPDIGVIALGGDGGKNILGGAFTLAASPRGSGSAGGSGAGGYPGTSAAGGGSGAGGRAGWFCFRSISGVTIESKGGRGGNGQAAAAGPPSLGGAGGGGGAGGAIRIKVHTGGLPTIDVSGGAGGSGGSGADGGGGHGGNGGDGIVDVVT